MEDLINDCLWEITRHLTLAPTCTRLWNLLRVPQFCRARKFYLAVAQEGRLPPRAVLRTPT